jgi:hypothetical protein
MASAMPVKEAVDMITFLLPFTFGATILFSIVFSYLYSRRITRPIFHKPVMSTLVFSGSVCRISSTDTLLLSLIFDASSTHIAGCNRKKEQHTVFWLPPQIKNEACQKQYQIFHFCRCQIIDH